MSIALVARSWPLSAAVCALALGVSAQTWSTPVDVTQSSIPTALRAVLRTDNGTEELVYRSGSGIGSEQLYHRYRAPGQAWTNAVLVSTPGDSTHGAEIPCYDGYRFCFLDHAGHVQLVFQKWLGGITYLWHTHFDTHNPGAGWSTPVAVSSSASAATGVAFAEDSLGNLHLCWRQVPGAGTPQLWHAMLPPGGSWSTPVLLSTPGSPNNGASFPARHGNRFLIEDATEHLHVFFEQLPALGVQEVYHRRLDLNNVAGGWSPAVAVSGSGAAASAEAVELDQAGALHLFWRAIPGLGAPQLFHARLSVNQLAWSSGAVISTPGTPNFGAQLGNDVDFVRQDSGGMLHVVFDQVPGIGSKRVYVTDCSAGSATFSTPVAVTPSGVVHSTLGVLVDGADRLHVLTESPGGGFTPQIWHAYRNHGGSFNTPVMLSTPGSPNFGASLSIVHEVEPMLPGPNGELHVLFEQVPGAGGPSRVFGTSLDLAVAGAAWSTPADISGNQNGAARLYQAIVDVRSEVHAVFGASPAVGSYEQLFEARRARDGSWAAPVQLTAVGSPTAQAKIPVVPWGTTIVGNTQVSETGYRYLDENGRGTVDTFFEKLRIPGSTEIWQTSLDRFTLYAATRVAGPGDLVVAIDNVPAGAIEGFTFLSVTTAQPVGAGWFEGLEPDFLTGASLSIPASPGNWLHWTWPVNPPTFPASPFGYPPGFLPVPAGLAIDFIAVTLDGGPDYQASNVVRVVF